jgi:hypothetical protein
MMRSARQTAPEEREVSKKMLLKGTIEKTKFLHMMTSKFRYIKNIINSRLYYDKARRVSSDHT